MVFFFALKMIFFSCWFIPTLSNQEELGHLWPISICNTMYYEVFDYLIKNLSVQSQFHTNMILFQGVNISDNVLLNDKFLHLFNKRHSGSSTIANVIRIGLSKNYDNVNRYRLIHQHIAILPPKLITIDISIN